MTAIRRRAAAGFTLLEMMIVVLIIAILAAIAIPIYQNVVREGRRPDAVSALSNDQQILNTCYAQTYDYTSASCPPLQTVSSNGFYDIQVNSTTSTYTLTALPQGDQTNDTTCAQFTVNNLNQRAAQDATGADTTATCW